MSNCTSRFLVLSSLVFFAAGWIGCGGEYLTEGRHTFRLTVNSNPAGVTITADKADLSGNGNGTTPFVRDYIEGTTVTLTAPATLPSGAPFSSWTGCDSTSALTTGGPQVQCTVKLLTSGQTVAANYGASTPSSTPPTITSANTATFTVGAVSTFAVTATGSPTPTLSRNGTLPSGVTFVDQGGNGTATLSGTPAAG